MNEHLKEKTANQKIHEWLGKCWHEYGAGATDDGYPKCQRCGERVEFLPAYDTDLNEIAEVEAKVIETFGAQRFGNAIYQQLREPFQLHPRDEFEMIVTIVATASASVRAAAIVALIEEKTK